MILQDGTSSKPFLLIRLACILLFTLALAQRLVLQWQWYCCLVSAYSCGGELQEEEANFGPMQVKLDLYRSWAIQRLGLL